MSSSEISSAGLASIFDALDGMSASDLTDLISAAETKRAEKIETAKDEILERARAELSKLGLVLDGDVIPAGNSRAKQPTHKAAGAKIPAKYRGPKGEEWSGRGRLPQWISDIEKQGKSREDFAVKK